MRQLNITLITPDGMELQNTRLPDDLKTEEIISELKEQLGLPGDPVRYFLIILGRDITMAPGQSLRDAGMESGDKLKMMASQPVQATNGIVEPVGLMDGAINVQLSVLDPNRSEEFALPADQTVAAIISGVFSNLKSAHKPKYGGINDYRLQSKALGRYLLPSETPRGAGIPHGDRLSIHKNDTAGATR